MTLTSTPRCCASASASTSRCTGCVGVAEPGKRIWNIAIATDPGSKGHWNLLEAELTAELAQRRIDVVEEFGDASIDHRDEEVQHRSSLVEWIRL